MAADSRAEGRRPRAEGRGRWSRFATGLIILAAGVIFWLDQINRIEASELLRLWPIAPIVIGLAHLLERDWPAGVVWLAVGCAFGLRLFGYDDFSFRQLLGFFPLFITAAGITLVMHALRAPAISGVAGGFQATSVMAGNVRRIASPSPGGQAVAVMGGCQIDVAASALMGREFVIDVLAFWGGIEVKVPVGWNVVNEVTPILGGVDIKIAPASETAPRVILRGSVIMGSAEVRNSAETMN